MEHHAIARTGRVQSWLDDPTSRLPVSCTVFVVEDEMEGPDGIEESWRFVSHALRNGAGVAVHLSKLRPAGTDNGRGLVASGPVSFAPIYSALNQAIRRGGVYKNGAVVLHLDLSHPDILQFIRLNRSEIPWVKRCVDLEEEDWDAFEHKDELLAAIKSGDIWLNKIKYDSQGERIYGNVCLEVYLPHRGTCLLEHVNLGACRVEDIPKAFEAVMINLVELHGKTGVGETGQYLPPAFDRQVGLGIIGLANLLAREGVTYKRFYGSEPYHAIAQGIARAALIAKRAGMERAFAIAPTASTAYRYKDLDGYTCTPEIAPPISRQVDRDSGTFGVVSYDHGPVEIASEVGWHPFIFVADLICTQMNDTGLFHGYSLNTWSDVVEYNEEFIEDWLRSPQSSIYYSLQVMPDTQAKDDALAAVDEEWKDFFAFPDDFLSDKDEEVEGFCPSGCDSCAE